MKTEFTLRSGFAGGGERLIHVFEKNGDTFSSFSRSILPVSAVERVKELDQERCIMVLTSGYEIYVKMTQEELVQKIVRPNFKTESKGILDLTPVTGAVAYQPEKEARERAIQRQLRRPRHF